MKENNHINMSRFKYPVDTDQFAEIREQDKLYVDKTDMLFDIVSKYKNVFLARPSGFGKSLLCNTFKAYFQGHKELFEGLKIMGLEREWKQYPVLYFIMSGLKNCTIPEAKNALELLINDYEKIYGRDSLSRTPGNRLSDLIHRVYERTGEKVVVIIDDYDSAILRYIYSPEQLEAINTVLTEFFQELKDVGEYLKFVFITGVTNFSQHSIFSELNLYQISMLDEYSGLCGITQQELDTTLRPCMEEYARNLKITADEAYSQFKKYYNGYHFSPKSKDVYAPFSLLNALSHNNIKYYWFRKCFSISFYQHFRQHPKFNPFDFDGIELSLNTFNTSCQKAETPIPLLYQTGYLTIQSYDDDKDTYILHFPNCEVRQGMIKHLTNELTKTDNPIMFLTIYNMVEAFNRGDLPAALLELRLYIASLPYYDIMEEKWMAKKSPESFYKFFLYVIFSLLNNEIDTEIENMLGRADVVIKTKTDIYVLEFLIENTVDNALTLINSEGYTIRYEADGRNITKCGVRISSDQMTVTHWRIVDADGNIVAEKKF